MIVLKHQIEELQNLVEKLKKDNSTMQAQT